MIKTIVGYANSFLIGDILIDAALEVPTLPNGLSNCIITHEHCDHFGSLDKIDCKVVASETCARIINEKDSSGLCQAFSLPFPNKKVEKIVKENDVVETDGFALKVIETPGHARGSICLYEEDKKFLFSGDTVFPDLGMPRTDLPTSEPEKLKSSYEKLISLDIEKIFPGHGGMITEKDYVKRLIQLLD